MLSLWNGMPVCFPKFDGSQYLLDPWLLNYDLSRIRYSRFKINNRIVSYVYYMLVFLPQFWNLFTLRVTAENLMERLSYTLKRGSSSLLLSKLYNIDGFSKGAVSRGVFEELKISKRLMDLYMETLDLIFSLTPLTVYKELLWSPNLCTYVYRTDLDYLNSYCYGRFLAFLRPDLIRRVEGDKWVAWSKLVELCPKGVKERKIYLLIPEDMLGIVKAIGPAIYKVTGEVEARYKANSLTKKLYRAVELEPFRLSPEEVVPFLYPYHLSEEDSQRRVISYYVRTSIVYDILDEIRERFPFYSGRSTPLNFKKRHMLSKVEDGGDYLNYIAVNPSYVISLLKSYNLNNRHGIHARRVLDGDVLSKVISIEESSLARLYDTLFFLHLEQRKSVFTCIKDFFSLKEEPP